MPHAPSYKGMGEDHNINGTPVYSLADANYLYGPQLTFHMTLELGGSPRSWEDNSKNGIFRSGQNFQFSLGGGEFIRVV